MDWFTDSLRGADMCFETVSDRCLGCSAYVSNYARGGAGDCMGDPNGDRCRCYESMAEVERNGRSAMVRVWEFEDGSLWDPTDEN